MTTTTRWAALALLALAVGCGSGDAKNSQTSAGASQGEGEHKLAELTVDEVDARIAKNDATFKVYDCNPKEVFDAGRVPGSKWIDYDKVTDDVLGAKKDDTLVFYCANEH